jgi:osmotically-inducible protein OsmY
MNHERFAGREDERSDSGHNGEGRHRYSRRSMPERDDRYDQSMRYGGEQDRDERGQFRGGSEYGGRPYGRGGFSTYEEEYGNRGRYGMEREYGGGRDRDRDSQGRFVSERGGDYRGGWEQERDRYGRFMSDQDFETGRYNRSYGGGMGWNERDRDSMGRFTSDYQSGSGRYGRGSSLGQGYGGRGRGMSGGGDMSEMPRDDQGRFTSPYTSGSTRSGRNFGPHTGRGPKNYTRSDERIREEVSDRLEQDGDIDASEIEVKAQNGLVTLSGSVETRQEKHMAEQLAEDCAGVKDVQNLIKVSGRQSEYGRQTGSNDTSQQTGSHQSDQKQHGRK